MAFNDIGVEISNYLADAATTNATINQFVGFMVTDRAALIRSIEAIDGPRLHMSREKTPFLRIVLPCGNVREWLAAKDIPAKSIQCHCPDLPHIKEHRFIKYEGVA